jgi:hypothetical protein
MGSEHTKADLREPDPAVPAGAGCSVQLAPVGEEHEPELVIEGRAVEAFGAQDVGGEGGHLPSGGLVTL